MKRVIAIMVGFAAFALSTAKSAPRDACWCSKNGEVIQTTQSDCDAIGGTPYKTKEQALANGLMGLSSPDDFHTISAAAAKKFDTSAGYKYAEKFAFWLSRYSGPARFATDPAGHALHTCASIPNTELHCDVVFLVAADGRIRKMLFAPNNPYEQCVSRSLRTSGLAPKPPADSWPIHIRLIDGVRPRYKGGDAPFLIFNEFWPPDRVNPR